MRSLSTGRFIPRRCKSWLCPTCNVFLRDGAARLIRIGAHNRPEGTEAALFTFTEPARATLDLPAFLRRHEATIKRLRRAGLIGAYCTSVEFQKRGALHPHVIAHVPEDLVPCLRPANVERRDRTQYRFWSSTLRELAVEVGWGPVCDAVLVDATPELAHYATKSLAGYATKEAHRKFKRAGARRVRPIRRSNDWIPDRLRDLQRGARADPGPFIEAAQIGPCGAT